MYVYTTPLLIGLLLGAQKDKFLSQSNNNLIRVLDTQKKALNWLFIRETGYRINLRLETANSFGPLCHKAGELHLLCLPIQVVWQELEELVQHVAGDHPQYSSTRP